MVSSVLDTRRTIRSTFDTHVQGLRNGWKVGTEREFVNDMSKVHNYLISDDSSCQVMTYAGDPCARDSCSHDQE